MKILQVHLATLIALTLVVTSAVPGNGVPIQATPRQGLASHETPALSEQALAARLATSLSPFGRHMHLAFCRMAGGEFSRARTAFLATHAAATSLFGITVIKNFLRPDFAPVVHAVGIALAAPFVVWTAYSTWAIFRPVGRWSRIWNLVTILPLLAANAVYLGTDRDMAHDLRVFATATVRRLVKANEFLVPTPQRPRIVLQNERPSQDLVLGTAQIQHSGVIDFTAALHYVTLDPTKFRIGIGWYKNPAELVRETGAVVGMNAGYLSYLRKNQPLGLVIDQGKTVFPYTSSRIRVTLKSGRTLLVPAKDFLRHAYPFDDLSMIASASQFAPDGLEIKDGRVTRPLADGYLNPLLGVEAVLCVLGDGHVQIVPQTYYEENRFPFDRPGQVREAIQLGPLTLFNGTPSGRERAAVEPTRGKVAYALDDQGRLHMLTTDSLRGVYGESYTEFTEELLAFGRSRGTRFMAIAFGDAGGLGTLTVRDPATQQYAVTGAAIKYYSATTLLVFRDDQSKGSTPAAPTAMDWRTIDAERFLRLAETSQSEMGVLISKHPSLFLRWLKEARNDQRSLWHQVLLRYLRQDDQAGETLSAAFTTLADQHPSEGLVLMEWLGSEGLPLVFGYDPDHGAMPKAELLMAKCLLTAPDRAARLLVALSRESVPPTFTHDLSTMPRNRLAQNDIGEWLAYVLPMIDPARTIDVIREVRLQPHNDIALAEFFRTVLLGVLPDLKESEQDIALWNGLHAAFGERWVVDGIIGTVRDWFPRHVDYYYSHPKAFKAIERLPEDAQREIRGALSARSVRWTDLIGLATRRRFIDHTEAKERIRWSFFRQKPMGDTPAQRQEDDRRALENCALWLDNGDLREDVETLGMLSMMKSEDGRVPELRAKAFAQLKAAVNGPYRPMAVRFLSDLAVQTDQALQVNALQELARLYLAEDPLVSHMIRSLLALSSDQAPEPARSQARARLLREASPIRLFIWFGEDQLYPFDDLIWSVRYRPLIDAVFARPVRAPSRQPQRSLRGAA